MNITYQDYNFFMELIIQKMNNNKHEYYDLLSKESTSNLFGKSKDRLDFSDRKNSIQEENKSLFVRWYSMNKELKSSNLSYYEDRKGSELLINVTRWKDLI